MCTLILIVHLYYEHLNGYAHEGSQWQVLVTAANEV